MNSSIALTSACFLFFGRHLFFFTVKKGENSSSESTSHFFLFITRCPHVLLSSLSASN